MYESVKYGMFLHCEAHYLYDVYACMFKREMAKKRALAIK